MVALSFFFFVKHSTGADPHKYEQGYLTGGRGSG
jgi:hypothetical protein